MSGPLHEYMQYLSIQTFKGPTSLPQLIAINSPLPQPVSVVVRNYTEWYIIAYKANSIQEVTHKHLL